MGFSPGAIIGETAWTLVKKLAPYVFVLLLFVVIAGLWLYAGRLEAEVDLAKRDLDLAVGINQENAVSMQRIQADAEANRQAVLLLVDQRKNLLAEGDAIKRELRNAPGASDLAGPYFDDLADRLRARKAAHQNPVHP